MLPRTTPTESSWFKTLLANLRRSLLVNLLVMSNHVIYFQIHSECICGPMQQSSFMMFFEWFHACKETCRCNRFRRKVLFDHLMHTLLRLEVHPLFIGWLVAALLQRKVVLWCGIWSSQVITICNRLPQGSLMSPVCECVHCDNYC